MVWAGRSNSNSRGSNSSLRLEFGNWVVVFENAKPARTGGLLQHILLVSSAVFGVLASNEPQMLSAEHRIWHESSCSRCLDDP